MTQLPNQDLMGLSSLDLADYTLDDADQQLDDDAIEAQVLHLQRLEALQQYQRQLHMHLQQMLMSISAGGQGQPSWHPPFQPPPLPAAAALAADYLHPAASTLPSRDDLRDNLDDLYSNGLQHGRRASGGSGLPKVNFSSIPAALTHTLSAESRSRRSNLLMSELLDPAARDDLELENALVELRRLQRDPGQDSPISVSGESVRSPKSGVDLKVISFRESPLADNASALRWVPIRPRAAGQRRFPFSSPFSFDPYAAAFAPSYYPHPHYHNPYPHPTYDSNGWPLPSPVSPPRRPPALPSTTALPSPYLTGHTLTAIGERLYLFGGAHAAGAGACTNDLWVFDTDTSTWSRPVARGGAPSPRRGHSAASWGRRLFVFGGMAI
ncbi:hypothetical protein HK405_000169 [Cladochytrium tenue]|nr:hypothetical protein HK405_000169 [Cladochytrium tenue]